MVPVTNLPLKFHLYHAAKLVIPFKKDKLPYEQASSESATQNINSIGTSSLRSSAVAPLEANGDMSVRASQPTTPTEVLQPHLTNEWEYDSLPEPELIKYKQKLQSEYVLHLFWHPEDALPRSPLWKGLPRKIKDKLRCQEDGEEKEPHGFTDGSTRVCRLNRALYGLRKAPLWWFETICEALKQHGFQPMTSDRRDT